MEESVIGCWIRQIRVVYSVGFTAILLLVGGGVTTLQAQSSGKEHVMNA
jgi:hypothetical protein